MSEQEEFTWGYDDGYEGKERNLNADHIVAYAAGYTYGTKHRGGQLLSGIAYHEWKAENE